MRESKKYYRRRANRTLAAAGFLAGVVATLLLAAHAATAQPVSTLRQFYFSPYIMNPAFTGLQGSTEITLVHRRQWVNIEDAPTVTGAFFQYATSTRSSFGLSVASQEAVALRNTTANGSFAYHLPIGGNHALHFGLSLGAGFNKLDLDGDYSNDPTILNASASNAYLDGSFGLLYVWGNLKIGAAVPTLFEQPYFNSSTLGNRQFTQLLNQLYSLSYTLNFGNGLWTVEPYVLYKLNRDFQNTWQGDLLLYYQRQIWLGASYNESLGLGFYAGLSIRDRFQLGYGFELPTIESNLTNTSSHEIRVSVRFGEKKKTKAEQQ